MKRSRAPNFTTAEIMHLLRLVEKFPVIENKKTDGATARDKQEAWQTLTSEYNSQTKFSPRTSENLLACYKNQKIKAKKIHSNEKMAIKAPLLLNAMEIYGQDWDQVAQATKESSDDCQIAFNHMVKEVKKQDASLKREINRTGGGPPPQPSCSSDPVMQKVKTLIGPALEGLYTMYDGDAEFMQEQQISLPIDEQVTPIEYPVDISQQIKIDSTPDHVVNRSCDVKRLNIMKNKIDPSLESIKKGKKKNVSHSFQELAGDKIDLVKAQRTLANLQMQHVQLEMELAEEKLQFEKRKNEIELEKLQFSKKKDEMELNYLKEKYEIELGLLRNKKYE